MPEAALCRGSAGFYNLVQAKTAHELGERKVEKIASPAAQVVATANPGCKLQLVALLHEMELAI